MSATTCCVLAFVAASALLFAGSPAAAETGPIFLVKDIETTGIPFRIQLSGFLTIDVYGSFPILEATTGNLAFFRARHHDYGEELWVSDGTEAGTKLLRDICPGPCWSKPTAGNVVGNVLLFAATDVDHGRELWRTDGTPEGTFLVKDFCPGSCSTVVEERAIGGAILGGLTYFPVVSADGSQTLWRTDGSPGGTIPFRQLCPPGGSGTYGPQYGPLTVYRERLYFTGLPGAIWSTDGTAGGTIPVPDQAMPGYPRGRFQGQLILVGSIEGDTTLFRSDGTVEGTAPLKIFPGFFDAHSFLEHRGELYFAIGGQVWKTDGTPIGTKTVAAVYSASDIRRWGDRLIFTASGTAGGPRVLWVTDGAPGSAQPLALPPGTTYKQTGVTDGQLLMTLEDAVHGQELWVSEGSLGGDLRLLQDLALGAESSFAGTQGAVGDAVFLLATTPETGYEPYAVKRQDLAPNRCLDGPDVLCLLDGRFEVRARFVDPREPGSSEKTAGSLISSEASGRFWFFDAKSSELVVKLLDGGPVNGHFWFFWGALSDVEYSIDVKDWATGATRTFDNPRGQICGGAEVEAFPAGSALASAAAGPVGTRPEILRPPELLAAQPIAARDPEPRLTPREDGPTSRCDPGPQTLCLLDGKVEVKVEWEHPTLGAGVGRLETTDDTSAVFSFFGPGIPELVVKLLDGGPINGHYWLFSGALSDVEYRLHLREVATGRQRTFVNPAGQLCGIADVEAL